MYSDEKAYALQSLQTSSINIVSLTVVSMLYIRSSELIILYLRTYILWLTSPHFSYFQSWQLSFCSVSINSPLFFFSDSTCKWHHMVFVLLHIVYLFSIMPFRFEHVIAKRKILFSFFLAFNTIPLCMCTYVYVHIYNIFYPLIL